MTTVKGLSCLSGAAFVIYGILCFSSTSMANDFHRFGMDDLRVLTGILELLGGTGLLIGLKWPPALWISAAGLALLMLIAFLIRMRMHDGVAVSAPSFTLMVLNLYIAIRSPKAMPFAAIHRSI
jgi:uncharacterized membrane protein YphA (DoxX/SURF4 family)